MATYVNKIKECRLRSYVAYVVNIHIYPKSAEFTFMYFFYTFEYLEKFEDTKRGSERP